MSDAEKYLNFYIHRGEGRGLGGNFKNLRIQRGDGLGSILSGALKRIFPLIKSGAKFFGSELLDTGIGILRDNIAGKSMKESVRSRVTAAGTKLTNKAASKLESMVGSGLKAPRKRKRAQSKRSTRKKTTSKKRRKQKDIFSR
jgi:hypothetical protein